MRRVIPVIFGGLLMGLAVLPAGAFDGPDGLMRFDNYRVRDLSGDWWIYQYLFDVDSLGNYSNTVSYDPAHGGGMWKAPAIGDVDNDGGQELVVFYNYESATGNDYSWGHMWDIAPDGTLSNYHQLVDFGSGGWYTDDRTLQPAIGDYDNDGVNELLTAHNWGGYHGVAQGARVYVTELDSNGNTVPGTWFQLYDWVGDDRNYSLAVGDLTGDGLNEIILWYNYPNLSGAHMNYAWMHQYDENGVRFATTQIADWSSDWLGDIALGDIDNDGAQELVVARNYLTETGTDLVWQWAYEWTGGGLGNAVNLQDGAWLEDRFCTVAAASFPPADCAEVWARGQGLQADINQDCYVNLLDFAIMAGQWRATEEP